jgi:hypothetical protein
MQENNFTGLNSQNPARMKKSLLCGCSILRCGDSSRKSDVPTKESAEIKQWSETLLAFLICLKDTEKKDPWQSGVSSGKTREKRRR